MMVPSSVLSTADGSDYKSLVSALQHLTLTRPDLAIRYRWFIILDSRRSASGFYVCLGLGDNLVSWSSKRQTTMSRSSAEVVLSSSVADFSSF
jgi:hypothetical protein